MAAVAMGALAAFVPYVIFEFRGGGPLSILALAVIFGCALAGGVAGWLRPGRFATEQSGSEGSEFDIEIPHWAGWTLAALGAVWLGIAYAMLSSRVDPSNAPKTLLVVIPIVIAVLLVMLVLLTPDGDKQAAGGPPRRNAAISSLVGFIITTLVSTGFIAISAHDAAWMVFGVVVSALFVLIVLTVAKSRRMSR